MKKNILILVIFLTTKINAQWSILGNSFYSTPPTTKIKALLLHKQTGNLYAGGYLRSPSLLENTLYKFSAGQWNEALNSNNINSTLFSELQFINDLCQDSSGNVFLGTYTNIGVSGGGPIYSYYPIIKYDGIAGTIYGRDYPTTQCATEPITSLVSSKAPYSSDNYIYAAGLFINEYYKKTIVYSSESVSSGGYCGYSEIRGIDSTQNLLKLCKTKQNDLVSTGRIQNALGYYIVAKGNGGMYWDELGGNNTSKFNNEIMELGVNEYSNSNDIYAVGRFTNSSGKRFVAKWNGVNWSELGGVNSLKANGDINSICFDGNNNVYVAGDFKNAAGKRYVAKWDGINWTELGGFNNLSANNTILKIVADSLGNVYAAGSFTDTNNQMYVAKFSSPLLPLKLLSFTTKLQQNSVALNWQTTNEINVSHINIQRSLNGKDFTAIGKANAACCEYSFVDGQQSTVDGKLYYKLEIVDKDGSKTYSEIRNLELGIRNKGISIYPNPTTSIVTIQCTNAKELLIIDYLGKTVYQSTVKGELSTVNCKQLTKGIYLVKAIMNNGEVKTEKLIIN